MSFWVRGPLASLDDQSHILLRQALIYMLRILVPAIYVLTMLSAVAVTVLDGTNGGMAFRGAAIAALAACIAATLGGTAPINKAVLEWSASAPPATWRTQNVDREHTAGGGVGVTPVKRRRKASSQAQSRCPGRRVVLSALLIRTIDSP